MLKSYFQQLNAYTIQYFRRLAGANAHELELWINTSQERTRDLALALFSSKGKLSNVVDDMVLFSEC
jgi:hypothetical protein